MAQGTTSGKRGTGAQPRSMADAIARAKHAAAQMDRAKDAGVLYTKQTQRVLFNEARIPKHPHARLVQRISYGLLIGGALMIIFLPDVFIVHWIAFTAMFALLLAVMPNFVLQKDGAFSPTKGIGWLAFLLFFGAMTATAAGDTGNLWSWAPWLQQFSAGSHTPQHVTVPHP
jgi:hypothetical protein